MNSSIMEQGDGRAEGNSGGEHVSFDVGEIGFVEILIDLLIDLQD